jgi:hypothetical protein
LRSPRLLLTLSVLAVLAAGCQSPAPFTAPLADDEEPAATAEQDMSAAPTPDAGPTRTERAAITADDQDVAYDPPLVIEEGGTYRGAWESGDPEVAAVTIATTEPVII